MSRWVVPVLLAATIAPIALAPAAVAAPTDPVAGTESARAVINDLKGQGYNVEINWVSGISSVPLSECFVTGIDNPDHDAGPPTTFTTVYVDVSCPNHPDG
jgi:hypothetical protein